MHFTTVTTLLLASLTAALPTDPEASTSAIIPTDIIVDNDFTLLDTTTTTTTETDNLLTRRDLVYKKVELCTDANRKGRCATQSFAHNRCYNMQASWNDKVSSVYPGRNTKCRLFADGGCRGAAKDLLPNTHIDDLARAGFDNRLSSIICVNAVH